MSGTAWSWKPNWDDEETKKGQTHIQKARDQMGRAPFGRTAGVNSDTTVNLSTFIMYSTGGAQPGWVGGLCRGAVSGCVRKEEATVATFAGQSLVNHSAWVRERPCCASEIDQKEGFTRSHGLEALALVNNIYLLRIPSISYIVTQAFLGSPQILAK